MKGGELKVVVLCSKCKKEIKKDSVVFICRCCGKYRCEGCVKKEDKKN